MVPEMIYSKKIRHTLFCLLLSAVLFESAWADCVPSTTTPTIVFSDITIQADLPVGSLITTANTSYTINCNRNGFIEAEGSWLLYLSAANYSAGDPLPGFSNVVPTGIPGIGMRWTSWTSAVGDVVMTTSRLNDTNTNRGIPALPGGDYWTRTSLRDTVELIKTGPIQAGSQLVAINQIAIWRKSALGSVNPTGDLYNIMFTPFNLINASCTIDQNNINVFLGSVHANEFSGVGTTSDNVDFSIDLTCVQGTRINLTLSNLNALPGFPGTIKLEGADPAQGVGIQIVDGNNTPVPLGTSRFIATSSTPNVFIPLAARYIQTEATIRPGPANAVLLFTINYI